MGAQLNQQHNNNNSNNSSRPKRHGFHAICQSCDGAKSVVGGIENPKQFSKILQDYKKQHLQHQYELKQSYHAAELGHASQTQTTRQTASGTAYVDFTNNSISAASFTTGKKYLLSVT